MSASRSRNQSRVGVIDIFAGPGGLGEGFSRFEPAPGSGVHPFEIAVSAEMESSAHATLRLRAFVRQLIRHEGCIPGEYFAYLELLAKGEADTPCRHFAAGRWRALWCEAEQEALNLTLGEEPDTRMLFDRISSVRKDFDEMVLIGGPPCQAYSLVGRARQKNVVGFRTKGDTRHFLYKQYLGILAKFAPAVFIMENVKGILTSKVGNNKMFSAIMQDLSNPAAVISGSPSTGSSRSRYVLLPVHIAEGESRASDLVEDNPGGFVIRCEDHGIPQARHRVIIMGIREDVMHPGITWQPGLAKPKNSTFIETALADLPALRSGLSRRKDDREEWSSAAGSEQARVLKALGKSEAGVSEVLAKLIPAAKLPRSSIRYATGPNAFSRSLRDPRQSVVLNHDTRGHMASDLGRYMFCAAFAAVHHRSPSSSDFPMQLAPDHQSWTTGAFADRFRVQLKGRPSSTVTSHLSKDGHAFIHWDPRQCRSITVREAARLQTFSDDYVFLGNRTQQYIQVGNAVPPLIATQIAGVVWSVLERQRSSAKVDARGQPLGGAGRHAGSSGC